MRHYTREWLGNQTRKSRHLAKNDTRFWRSRLFKPKDGRSGTESPHYSVRIAHGGVRRSVSLGTGNADAAATRARNLHQDAVVLGLDAAIAKLRPKAAEAPLIATIGDWIEAAAKVSDASKTTIGQYGLALRLIAGQILAVAKSKKRFAPGKKKGAAEYRNAIDQSHQAGPLDFRDEDCPICASPNPPDSPTICRLRVLSEAEHTVFFPD